MENRIKDFKAKTIDDLEEDLDNFVSGLERGQLVRVSSIQCITSGLYTITCEYKDTDA